MKNSTEQYGWMAKLLHWLVALMLVGMVWAGLTFEDMARGPERDELKALHMSFGMLLLAIMVVRLVWKLMNEKPADPPGTPGWQGLAATATHWILYAGIFFQLTVGLLVAGQRPISFFGLFDVGPLVAEDREMHEFYEDLHVQGWKILAIIVGLHVLAALYHHFVKKDDVLKRMTTG